MARRKAEQRHSMCKPEGGGSCGNHGFPHVEDAPGAVENGDPRVEDLSESCFGFRAHVSPSRAGDHTFERSRRVARGLFRRLLTRSPSCLKAVRESHDSARSVFREAVSRGNPAERLPVPETLARHGGQRLGWHRPTQLISLGEAAAEIEQQRARSSRLDASATTARSRFAPRSRIVLTMVMPVGLSVIRLTNERSVFSSERGRAVRWPSDEYPVRSCRSRCGRRSPRVPATISDRLRGAEALSRSCDPRQRAGSRRA